MRERIIKHGLYCICIQRMEYKHHAQCLSGYVIYFGSPDANRFVFCYLLHLF